MLGLIFFTMAPLTPPPPPPMELPENRYGLIARQVEIEESEATDDNILQIFTSPEIPNSLKTVINGQAESKTRPHWRKSVWGKIAVKVRRFKRTGFRNH